MIGISVGLVDESQPTRDSVAAAAVRGIVARRELFERLAAAGRVTVVSAPPGSGKTQLLRAWFDDAGLTDSAAWVSLGQDGTDSERFWISVLDALRGTAAGTSIVRELTPAPGL